MSDAITRDVVAAPGRVSRIGMRRVLVITCVVVVLAGLGAYGRYWWLTARFFQSTDDAYVGGNITALAPHVAGFVAGLPVGDNDYVRAGQVLVRLDARDYRAALDRARAAVEAREAAEAGLQARIALQGSMIQEQQAELSARAAQSAFTLQESDRYRYLAQTSAGSRQAAQRSLSADQQARASVDSASAALEGARRQMAVLAAQIAEARAATAQARAEQRTAELDLAYTEVRAPMDGYVGNRAAQLGAFIPAGGYLLSVIPAAGLWVDANFKEDQLRRMRPGQSARVVADILPDRVFSGRIASLAPGTGAMFSVIPPENATGNFTKIVQRVPVRIALDAEASRLGALRPGLSITATVDTSAGAP